MRCWLGGYTELPSFPGDIRSFNAMGELLFWLGHLEIDSSLRRAISGNVIDKALGELPLYLFGEFVRGIRTCDSEAYEGWLGTRRDELVNYLRREAAFVDLTETDEALVAHYAIDLDRQSSAFVVVAMFRVPRRQRSTI